MQGSETMASESPRRAAQAANGGGTYTVDVSCSNCGYHGKQDVPKGQPAPGRGRSRFSGTCPNCGNSTLGAGPSYGPRW